MIWVIKHKAICSLDLSYNLNICHRIIQNTLLLEEVSSNITNLLFLLLST